jgi:hypothetical protein
MSTLLSRWSALVCVVGTLAVMSSGCEVVGGGYGYDNGGIGAAYYAPYGMDYGGWGPGYQVAPVRGGYNRPGGDGGNSGPHAYRAAPASHAMPSIPSGSRSGDSGPHRR